ncbi:MAG TPA: hypothetical protein PLW93_01350 [Candidatus Absconditabacterales bacterium]|nr:hypothetical protein [Candidatus Absconditabacterales bacterium]
MILDFVQNKSASYTNPIIYKTADYSILSSEKNKVFSFDTTSGTLNATLPLANSVSNGDKIYIKLWKGTNPLNINISGSDVIDDGSITTQLKLTDTNRTGIELVSDGINRRVAVLDFTGKTAVAFGEVAATKLWVSANNGQFTEANINTGAVVNVYTPSTDCNGCFSYTGMDKITIQHTTPSGYNMFTDSTNSFTTISGTIGNLVPYITKNQLYTLESRSTANSMTIRDINTNALVNTVPLGFTTNFGGDFFAEDSTYYYMSNYNNNRLHRINKLSFVVNTIAVVTSPMGVVIADGKIYVGSGATNTISVIDQASFTVITTIATIAGSRPAYGDWNKGNKVYFADRSGTARIFVINTITNTLLANVSGSTGGQYIQAGGIQYGNNDRLYVCSQLDGAVKVINTTTDAQISSRSFPTAQGLTIT